MFNYSINYKDPEYVKFRSAFPSWDNDARKPGKGVTFVNSTPDNYEKWLDYLLHYTNENRESNEKLIFLIAWNEWAEGNHLEPCQKWGHSYLQANKRAIESDL